MKKIICFLTLIIAVLSDADISPKEKQFIYTLINEYQVLGIAKHYCQEKLKATTDRLEQASYRWFLEADIPRISGDLEASQKANLALAKEFPKHPRAARARFDNLKIEMDRLTGKWDEALVQSDIEKRKAMLNELVDDFEKKVRTGFSALIKDLRSMVDKMEKEMPKIKPGEPRPDEYYRLVQLRNETEYFWILSLMRFADFTNQPGFKKKRVAALKEANKASAKFVDTRSTYYILRYLAQLQKGLSFMKLGDTAHAVSELQKLEYTTILQRPPWDDDLIQQIAIIHLRGFLNLIRCYNESSQYLKAAETSDSLFKGQPPPINLVALKEKFTSLQPYWVEAELESGIAIAGAGRPTEGASRIQKIIQKYSLKQKTNFQASKYVEKARSALARMVLVAGAIFPPETILEAGKGFKDQKDWSGAIKIFQIGLGFSGEPEERVKFYPVFLKELAECSYFAGDNRGMLMASLSALRHFAKVCDKDLRQRLANFALVSAIKIKKKESNAAIEELYKEAVNFFELYGDPALKETQKLNDGLTLKNDKQYQKAREIFLTVNPTYEHKNKKKPYNRYWKSRAEAADCLYQIYKKDKKKDPKKLATVENELKDAMNQAKAAKEISGLAASTLYLAILYTEKIPAEPEKALEILKLFDNELKSDTFYKDQALRITSELLMRKGKQKEAWEKLLQIKKEFPKSPEWGTLAVEGFYFYKNRGNFLKAAYYAEQYLAHPLVTKASTGEDLLFDFGFVFAKSSTPRFLKMAKEIFEPLWEKRASLDHSRLIKVGRGLVTIYRSEKKYLDAIRLSREILKDKKQEGSWVVDLKRELAMTLVDQAIIDINSGKKTKGAQLLLDAEEAMSYVFVRVKAAYSADPKRLELKVLLFEDYYKLLVIKFYLGKRQEVFYGAKNFLSLKLNNIPEALIKRYKKIYNLLEPEFKSRTGKK